MWQFPVTNQPSIVFLSSVDADCAMMMMMMMMLVPMVMATTISEKMKNRLLVKDRYYFLRAIFLMKNLRRFV